MKKEYLERREEEMSWDYPSYVDKPLPKHEERKMRLYSSDGNLVAVATLSRDGDEPLWSVDFEDQYWNFLGRTVLPAGKEITEKDLWSVYTPIAMRGIE